MVRNPNSHEARAGSNQLLTNLGQTEYTLPNLKMRRIIPFATVGQMGGLVPTFDSILKQRDIDDSRADGGSFAEIEDGYGSRPYKLKIAGTKYKLPMLRMGEAANVGIDWGRRATQVLMQAAQLKLEDEHCTVAGDPTNYESGHTTALDADTQFNSTSANKVDPAVTIAAANSPVRDATGGDCNVIVMGADVFDALKNSSFVRERLNPTVPNAVTEQMLANLYDVPLVMKIDLANTAMAGKVLLARVHESVLQVALQGDGTQDFRGGYRIPFRASGAINRLMPSYGFTYVYDGQPRISNRMFNDENEYYYYKLSFNRSTEIVGVNEDNQKCIYGHLLTNVLGA